MILDGNDICLSLSWLEVGYKVCGGKTGVDTVTSKAGVDTGTSKTGVDTDK